MLNGATADGSSDRPRGDGATPHWQFRDVIEGLPVIVIVSEPDPPFVPQYISQGVEALGYTADEWLATPDLWMQTIHADDRSRVLDHLERAFTSGEPADFRYRLHARDGTVRWFHQRVSLLRDEQGNPVAWRGFAVDVTAQAAAEAALRASEERFRIVQDASPDGFELWQCVRDDTGLVDFEVAYVNPAAARIIGRPPRELVGRRLLDVSPGFRGTGLYDAFARVVETGIPWQQEMAYEADAVSGVFRVVAVRVADGVAVSYSDVTERHRATEVVLHNEARLRALMEQAVDIVIVTDADGVARYVTPAFERVLGVPAAEVVGTNALARVHPEDRPRAAAVMERLRAQGGESEPEDFRIQRADGSWRALTIVARNLLDDPAVGGIVLTGHDMTVARRLEAQLRQAQKMEAVGQLAGGVAHDFNNLLTVITSYASLLRAQLPPDSALQEDVAEIEQASRRAAALTRQLLAFSRQQVVQPRVVDPNEIIRGLEKMLGRLIGTHIELALRLDPAAGSIVIDPGQLEQALTNLVVNARDAMPRGGRLEISTRLSSAAEVDEVRPVHQPAGSYVAIAVRDEGHGIAPEVMTRLFEPFFTTKRPGEGTGLGLATVHGIVEQSGGFVRVDSEVGGGATFTLYCPASPRSADEHPSAETLAAIPSRGSETVLLVEDDEAVREIARRILTARGYRILEASNGVEGLRVATDPTAAIDLLLTDVVMPQMGGLELLEAVRRHHPALPVILMSGYTDERVVQNGDLEPNVFRLGKPFTPEQLLGGVREALAIRRIDAARSAGP